VARRVRVVSGEECLSKAHSHTATNNGAYSAARIKERSCPSTIIMNAGFQHQDQTLAARKRHHELTLR
jgi:hypothetical protein